MIDLRSILIGSSISIFANRTVRHPRLGLALIALSFAASAGLAQLTGSATCFAIPVALAAVMSDWRIAVPVCAAASIYLGVIHAPQGSGAGIAALVVLTAALQWTTRRERNLRTHYQRIAEQLSAVYGKVQANFEGMKRAERLSSIGQLSAGLAHEIRNPLASISGAASILARNSGPLDATNAKCLEIIRSECDRLNGLLTNFLSFAGPRPPRLQAVPIEPVLDNVLGLAAHGIRGKQIHFEKQVEPGLGAVECDPEQIEQVLLNLMINAIEASPDGATVKLSACTRNSSIIIGVTDHGHGVAPSHIDRLFDPFFTTKEHGTGLGLPVAHQIVHQMGGDLLAQTNPTAGMTFSVVLPGKAPRA